MPYEVQKGDTIARVTSLMRTDWQALKRLNPEAVGRSSKSGNWFLREGAVLEGSPSFEASLRKSLDAAGAETRAHPPSGSAGPPTAPSEKDSDPAARWTTYTIQPGDTLWGLAVKRFRVDLNTLVEANGIRDPGRIHPGQVIRIPPARELPDEMEVVASWYGRSYHGRPMANGEFYNMYANTVAHRDLPFGTRVMLLNPETGERVQAVVKDRGPFVEGRDVDLSYGLARKLSLVEKGVGTLRMKVLG
jgi:rare lipoprotein A